MRRYGFIFARGGSKGLPGKNIKRLCGKPLLAYSIEAGRETGMLDDIIVSTDSMEIAEVAREYGASVPFMRPAALAEDNSPEWLAWQHAVSWLLGHDRPFDTFVALPATSPLRVVADVIHCIKVFEQSECDMVFTCTTANRHPMFNLYKIDEEGYAKIYDECDPPIFRRQNAPLALDGAGVAWVSSPSYILSNNRLIGKRVKAVIVPKERAVDIDDEFDFNIAEYYMRKRLATGI